MYSTLLLSAVWNTRTVLHRQANKPLIELLPHVMDFYCCVYQVSIGTQSSLVTQYQNGSLFSLYLPFRGLPFSLILSLQLSLSFLICLPAYLFLFTFSVWFGVVRVFTNEEPTFHMLPLCLLCCCGGLSTHMVYLNVKKPDERTKKTFFQKH